MRLPRRLQPDAHAELVEHLDELRSRLVIALVSIAVGVGVAYAFHHRLLSWLNGPLPPHHHRPVTFGVTEPFLTSFKVSLYAGIALALPVILWQLWAYLAPALPPHSGRVLFGFTAAASGLFAAGIELGCRVALPAAIHFLTNYDSHDYNIQIRASNYYSFALLALLAVGIVFELPVFMLALVRVGAMSSKKLRRNRRIGYVTMAALAVALPGVDPVTTAIEMLPLMLLFEASIWLAVLFERRWHTKPVAATAPRSS